MKHPFRNVLFSSALALLTFGSLGCGEGGGEETAQEETGNVEQGLSLGRLALRWDSGIILAEGRVFDVPPRCMFLAGQIFRNGSPFTDRQLESCNGDWISPTLWTSPSTPKGKYQVKYWMENNNGIFEFLGSRCFNWQGGSDLRVVSC
jgi:hypothetical protein